VEAQGTSAHLQSSILPRLPAPQKALGRVGDEEQMTGGLKDQLNDLKPDRRKELRFVDQNEIVWLKGYAIFNQRARYGAGRSPQSRRPRSFI